MLTVICWKWASTGWRAPYLVQHVNALKRMLEAHLKIPHRLICITDDKDTRKYECHTYPLWNEKRLRVNTRPGKPNCYQRLKLFAPEMREVFGERVLSIDLDVLIRSDITDLLDFTEDFKIMRGVAAPYNGSMWGMRTGARAQVWEEFHPVHSPVIAAQQKTAKGKNFYGSDQAWISYKIPGEATWPIGGAIYPYNSHIRDKGIPDDARIIFFAGSDKPWMKTVEKKCPGVYREYMQYMR